MFFLFHISYDGSRYYGSNKQPDKDTIIGELEKSLLRIFTFVKIKCFSRTDKYVHALGQVILVETNIDFNIQLLQHIINRFLEGKSIEINKIETRRNKLYFKDIKSRTYIFKFKKKLDVFDFFYYTKIGDIDLSFLQSTLNIFLGESDYFYFQKSNSSNQIDTIKKIYSINVKELDSNEIIIEITGSGFLRYMIRRIISTALSIKTLEEQEKLKNCLLEKKNIYNIFVIKKILPHGLYLKKIEFNE